MAINKRTDFEENQLKEPQHDAFDKYLLFCAQQNRIAPKLTKGNH
jgi:hypothetical protein